MPLAEEMKVGVLCTLSFVDLNGFLFFIFFLQELLSLIPVLQGSHLTWTDLRTYGAGWWISNINVLKRTFEKLAKDAFQERKDPMDASLFYLAMKKKNVLWGLFRYSGHFN